MHLGGCGRWEGGRIGFLVISGNMTSPFLALYVPAVPCLILSLSPVVHGAPKVKGVKSEYIVSSA